MVYQNILEAAGHTPMVRLNHMTGPDDAEVYVKYEGLNIGGSIKTRTALQMIEAAEKEGLLKSDSIIVEPTSGNQGIGLALVGAVKGYRVIIIMPDSVSEERRLLIRQYGAELKLIHDDNNIGECIQECIRTAQRMKEDDPRVFVPDQFSNPDTRIWAVEPEHAAILSGGSIGSHLQMGIGDGLIPPILDTKIYSRIEIVTDEEALETTRQLTAKEGILCGISSGTNVCAALRMAKELGRGKRVVTVLPDTGERYFSTDLFSA